ncbi:MAG: XisH family protein [Planctomycetes bacterium]|nr:XisH family protein [Planctomycetota bacterium]
MPARDKYHDQFRAALIKDGWRITDDPLHLRYGGQSMFVDLGAEEFIAAEKGGRKIAVEIKSFLGLSEIADLEVAIGQFVLYRHVMKATNVQKELYVAVTEEAYIKVFEEPVGQLLIRCENLRVIVFDPHKEEIRRWIP